MGIAKAIVGALIAGLGSLATALLDNSVAPVEWVGIASTTLVALYGVWQVPNAGPSKAVEREELRERLAPSHVRKLGKQRTWTTGGYPGGDPPQDSKT